MKFLSIFLVASFVFFSCKNQVTGYHLPPKVMNKLMLDVHMAETYSTFIKDTIYKAGSKNLDSLSVYYKDILAHYKITPEQFIENMEWYQNHPDDLDTIYNKMILTANTMQTNAPKIPSTKGTAADTGTISKTPAPVTPTPPAKKSVPFPRDSTKILHPKITKPTPIKDRGNTASPHKETMTK